MVSGALKFLNIALEAVNTNLGTSVIQVGGVLTVIGSLASMIQRFLIPAIKMSVGILGGWGIAIAGVVTGAIALAKAWKDANPSFEEATARIEDNTSKLEANQKRLEEINEIPWYDRTTEILEEKAAIEAENEQLEKNIERLEKRAQIAKEREAKQTLRKSYELPTGETGVSATYTGDDGWQKTTETFSTLEELETHLASIGKTLEDVNLNWYDLNSAASYTADEIDSVLISTLTTLSAKLEQGGKLTEAESQQLLKAIDIAHERSEANKVLGKSYESVDAALLRAESVYAESTEKARKFAESLHITYAASQELTKAYPELADAIEVVDGKILFNIGKLQNLSTQTASTKAEIMRLVAQETILSNSTLDLTQQIEALRQLGAQAGLAQAALAGLSGWNAETTEQQIQGLVQFSGYTREQAEKVIQNEMLNRLLGAVQPSTTTIDETPIGSGGGGGGTSVDKTLEAYKQIVSLKESELTLMGKQGKSEEEQIAKIKEIQEVLHQEAEYLRSIGASQEDINKLSSTWWEYQDKIVKLQEKSLEKLKEQYQIIADGLEKEANGYTALASIMKDYADEQIDALNEQLAALEATNKELDNQIALEEKLDAIARARESKVMVYKDGRFQYVEDVDAVSAAESDFADFQRAQEREVEKAAIEAQIATLEEYKKQWGDLTSSYEKEANKQLALEQFHIDAEKANWDEMLKNAKDYVDGYAALMGRLTEIKTAMSGDGSGLRSLGLIGGIGGGASSDSGYSSDIDYASKIISAINTGYLDEALHFAKLRDEKIQGEGITGVESTASLLRRLGVAGYANGTLSSNGGISLVGERGAELRVMNRGDGVIPADITRNLWQWGSINPQALTSMSTNKGMNVTIQTLNLPNVSDGRGFVEYVKNNMFGQVMSFVH